MLIKFFKKIFILLLPVVLFYGCAEEPAPVPAAKKVTAAKKKVVTPPKKKLAELEKEEAKKYIPPYVYDPSGKTDPFFPFLAEVAIESESVEEDVVPLTELEKFDLRQFKVVAVMVVGNNKKVAMLEDPKGVGHQVGLGMLIGENKGRVINIENGVVYVEEKSLDIMGDSKSNIFELAIETSEGVMR